MTDNTMNSWFSQLPNAPILGTPYVLIGQVFIQGNKNLHRFAVCKNDYYDGLIVVNGKYDTKNNVYESEIKLSNEFLRTHTQKDVQIALMVLVNSAEENI